MARLAPAALVSGARLQSSRGPALVTETWYWSWVPIPGGGDLVLPVRPIPGGGDLVLVSEIWYRPWGPVLGYGNPAPVPET